ncbi:MAG TPA: preprotein translocase subunit YajC [Acidothermaceae bacterium]
MGILLPVLIFVVFYVFIILPQGRKRRQAAALQKAVEPGSRVLLTSGLYAIVVEIETDTIILEAAEGVHLRYAKAAVLRVVPHLDELDDDEYDDDDDHEGHDHEGHDDDGHDDHDGHDHDGHDHDHDDVHDAAPPSDEVARPSNREDHQGNDTGSGPVSQA